MSNEAPNWFVPQWNTKVTHIYQSIGYRLKGTTTKPSKIVGKEMHFPIAGRGEAQQYARGDNVAVMNAARTEKTLTTEEFDAADYIYAYDLARMTVGELDVVRETAGMALGRKHDNLVFAMLQALTIPAARQVGAFASAWDLAKALQACVILQAQGVPWDGQVYCPMPALAFNQMLSFEQFSNSQWIGGDLPLTKTTTGKSWNGVNWFVLPDEHFKLSGTDRTFHMWHKSAVGSGSTASDDNQTVRTDLQWLAEKKGWFYNSTIDGGATDLLPEGIIECRMKSDSAISVV